MMMTSEELVLLEEYAVATDDGRWVMNDSIPYPLIKRSGEDTLGIIRACQYLCEPVTETISAGSWSKLVSKVAALEARLNERQSA
jgi:hypothetical protein